MPSHGHVCPAGDRTRMAPSVESGRRPGGPPWDHVRNQCRPLAVALALLISACTAAPFPAAARSAPDSFAPLVKQVLPAVVNIAVTETVAGKDPLAALPPELQRQFRERFKQRR